MPAYGSQLTSNSPLVAVTPDQTVPATLLNAETPAAGAASIAVALMARTANAEGLRAVAVRFSCPLGIGAGVFQIQDADFVDAAGADFDSINFGGATPGVVNSSVMNASGVSRVELLLRGRFLRVLCTTAPSNPITVTVE
jgi:hypothetical protein